MRDFVLPIRRTTPCYKLVDPEEEFAIMPPSMQAYLVMARAYFDDGKFAQAASAYRALLKRTQVLPLRPPGGHQRTGQLYGRTTPLAPGPGPGPPVYRSRTPAVPSLSDPVPHPAAWPKTGKPPWTPWKISSRWPDGPHVAGFDVGMASETLLMQLAGVWPSKAGLRKEGLPLLRADLSFPAGRR